MNGALQAGARAAIEVLASEGRVVPQELVDFEKMGPDTPNMQLWSANWRDTIGSFVVPLIYMHAIANHNYYQRDGILKIWTMNCFEIFLYCCPPL